jgi:hypothetical protein
MFRTKLDTLTRNGSCELVVPLCASVRGSNEESKDRVEVRIVDLGRLQASANHRTLSNQTDYEVHPWC